MSVETVAGSILARSAATAASARMSPLVETLLHVSHVRCSLATSVEEAETTAATDGGAIMACDNTLIRLLDRIDRVVADDSVWGSVVPTAVELTRKDLDARLARLDGSARREEHNQRPSVRYSRNLEMGVAPDGAAVVQLQVPGGSVLGVGDSFGAALADFDDAFSSRKPAVAPPPVAEPDMGGER